MAAIHTAPKPITDNDIFKEADSFKKRGDWTEERHEVLKNLTMDDIIAEAARLEAEHPEEYLSTEELDEKIKRIEEARTAKRRVEMVSA